MEDNIWWKTTFGEKQPFVEDDLWWNTIFGGRQPLVEDDLRRKTTFCGRRCLLEDNLRRKTTFGGRRLSLKEDLRRTLHAVYSALRHFLKPFSVVTYIMATVSKLWETCWHNSWTLWKWCSTGHSCQSDLSYWMKPNIRTIIFWSQLCGSVVTHCGGTFWFQNITNIKS